MKRIQRKRTKGWRMPESAVYVGRPTRWGNPWRVGQRLTSGETASAEDCVRLYKFAQTVGVALSGTATRRERWLAPLRDATALACWCPELCGEPVARYAVAYGEQYDDCRKPAGHAGHHDPSAPLYCHADVLIELLGPTA